MINNDDNHILRFHDITVNLLQLRVWHGPKEIHFTLAELRLLLAFLSDPYKTFTRDELINQADLTSVSYLQGVICRLRALLGQQYIYTRNRMGYSFIQPVYRIRRKSRERMLEKEIQ